MKIEWYGFDNIGWLTKRRYNKILLQHISDHIQIIDERQIPFVLDRLFNFTIRIFPTEMYKEIYGKQDFRTRDTGTLSENIPHEVVGWYRMDLFIIDSVNDLVMASNLMALSHGLGHVELFCFDPTARIAYKVPDLSGHKVGDMGNWSTVAVHNRTNEITQIIQREHDNEIQNQIYYLITYRFFGRWKPVKYRVFDFRDDLRS